MAASLTPVFRREPSAHSPRPSTPRAGSRLREFEAGAHARRDLATACHDCLNTRHADAREGTGSTPRCSTPVARWRRPVRPTNRAGAARDRVRRSVFLRALGEDTIPAFWARHLPKGLLTARIVDLASQVAEPRARTHRSCDMLDSPRPAGSKIHPDRSMELTRCPERKTRKTREREGEPMRPNRDRIVPIPYEKMRGALRRSSAQGSTPASRSDKVARPRALRGRRRPHLEEMKLAPARAQRPAHHHAQTISS